MLTEAQIDLLVKKVNDKINLPILGEKGEAFLFKFAIKKILVVLEKEIPEDFQKFIDNTVDGLVEGGENNIEEVKSYLITFLNDKVNIPIIGENAEKKLITEVVNILFDAFKKGNKLA